MYTVTVMTLRWWQQQNDILFYCNYLVKMLRCPTITQSGVESGSICMIKIVGSVPQKHSVGRLNWKVFLLYYIMGTLIRIELSATLSPDIFAITQPLLWDQDKAGESEQVQTMLRNFTIPACASQCEQTEQVISWSTVFGFPHKIIEITST